MTQRALCARGAEVDCCLFWETSYLTLYSQQRAKSCFPSDTKISHVKFYAPGKAGGGKPLMLKLLHSNSISDNAQAALFG